MEEKQSRIRWDDQELSRLAAAMAPCLLADPRLHPLEAARAAQHCLEPGRRRELKAWALVEGRLQPKLDEAMARLRAAPLQPAVDESASPPHDQAPSVQDQESAGVAGAEVDARPVARNAGHAAAGALPPSTEAEEESRILGGEATAATQDAAALGRSADLFDDQAAPQDPASADAAADKPHADGSAAMTVSAGEPSDHIAQPAAEAPAAPRHDEAEAMQATMLPTPGPLRIETALITALQSPAVEAALVELFARTMSKAALQAASEEPRPAAQPPRYSPAQRVLLAGFGEAQHRSLAEALGDRFEVRSWKPANGPQLLETLARLCRTVVLPEHADEEADAGLKDMDVRVIRHAGNASRLIERIEEAG